MDTFAVQRALVALGYSVSVDGVIGPKTKEAIKDFQQRHGLKADGVAGPKTIAALQSAVAEMRPAAPAHAPASPPLVTAATLSALSRACGAAANPIVVKGIADNAEWLAKGGVDTPARIAEFLAQACLETD